MHTIERKLSSNWKEEVRKIHGGLDTAFKKVRSEFDMQLDSINQNTNEIQATNEYMAELESKIDRLNERLDELQLILNPDNSFENFDVTLSVREQEVFLVLYTSPNELNYKQVARLLGLTEELVNQYVFNMISKGIPIKKSYKDDVLFVLLDKRFKDLQARRNIVKINESISMQLEKLQEVFR